MSKLSTKEETKLRLFTQRLDELLSSPIVKGQRNSLGTMSETIAAEKPETTVAFDGYDDDAFRAFYTTFRQFSMPKEEAVYFKDVCQLTKDKCERQELVDWVEVAEVRWDDVMNSSPVIGFKIDGKSYSNSDLLRLWLYGGRFHTDIKKAKLWNSLAEAMKADAILSIQAIVPKLVNCLVIVGSAIRWWLDATDEDVPAIPKP